MTKVQISEKYLLNVQEMMAYTGWGEHACRKLINDPSCSFGILKGNRLYAKRKQLERYIDAL